MSRDGRGNPGRIIPKNQPRLRLADVIRRRRTSLGVLVKEIGLTTYAGLEIWCKRMGVLPPTLDEFHAVVPASALPRVSSPQEGVIVLEPPVVIDEQSGKPIDPEAPVEPGVEVVTQLPIHNALVELSGTLEQPTKPTQKKAREKKDDQPGSD